MRFLLLTVLCSVVALTVAVNKPKRNILPGDPRYGTDHHNHDHHNHDHHENELEVSRSLGGYVGSFSVLDDGAKQGYGPPNYQPNNPLNLDQHRTSLENNAQVSLPSSYGVPEVNQLEIPTKQYLPAIEAAAKLHTKTLTSYLQPVEKTVPNKETVNNLATSVKVTSPVTSYGEPVEVKTVENIQKPTLYEVPSIKTSTVPLVDTKVEQAVVPQIQNHLKETKTVHNIQVKTQLAVPQVSDVSSHPTIDSSLVLPVNDHPTSFTGNVDFSNFAAPTVGEHSTFNDHLQSQPDFDSAYQVYLRNIGSFGNQQKVLNEQYPNLYVSPYTYGVPYQFSPTLYTSQVHQSLPSQLHNLVPYPLATNSHLFTSNVDVKQLGGSFGTFLQDTFPNFQFPSLPQFPNFISLFQKPTTPAPIADGDGDGDFFKTVEVQKPAEVKKLETTDNKFDSKSVVLDTSLTKTSTVTTEKKSNEYVQPVDENGAYVY